MIHLCDTDCILQKADYEVPPGSKPMEGKEGCKIEKRKNLSCNAGQRGSIFTVLGNRAGNHWRPFQNLALHTGDVVSVAATQIYKLQCESSQRKYIDEWEQLFSNKTLFIRINVEQDLAHGPQFSNPRSSQTVKTELLEIDSH